MADLSAYINFSAVLDKRGPELRLTDTGAYPAGVAQGLLGYFEVTQPDGLTIASGSFASPSIYWDNGALVVTEMELRLNTANRFQNGGYTLKYYLRHTDYDDTTLTKTFVLNYSQPVLSFAPNFDIFTPSLSVEDATDYDQDGMTTDSITRSWEAAINTVEGTPRTISGSQLEFDLAYQGAYYDSQYDVTLTVNPQYKLEAPDDWVTLIDELVKAATYYAQIPPTIDELDDSMIELKNTMDAAQGNCNLATTYTKRYLLASALYDDFRRLGCDNKTANLTKTLYQLLKLFNNNVNPVYENTGEEIPAYDFQCGGGSGGSVSWDDITNKPETETIAWVVDTDGSNGFPFNGQDTLTDARLANVPIDRVVVIRNGLQQMNSNPGDGDSYFTKASTASNQIVFHPALSTGEKIIVIILAI